jgi:hypothetical protein
VHPPGISATGGGRCPGSEREGEGDARNTATPAIAPNTEPETSPGTKERRVFFDDVERDSAPRRFELTAPPSLFTKEQRALVDNVDRNAGRVARGAAAMSTISSACRCDTGRYLGTEIRDAMCRPKRVASGKSGIRRET